jgi:hypothetical protein
MYSLAHNAASNISLRGSDKRVAKRLQRLHDELRKRSRTTGATSLVMPYVEALQMLLDGT